MLELTISRSHIGPTLVPSGGTQHMPNRKILLIVNAGRRDNGPKPELIASMEEKLSASGHGFEVAVSNSPDDAEQLFRDMHANGFTEVWVAGGDGSINHAVNQIGESGMVMGIVPMGTINALAQALHIPRDPMEAIDYLLNAHVEAMDLGKVASRYFICYATVGLHASIFHNINVGLKKRWGKLAFYESAVRSLLHKSTLARFRLKFEELDKNGEAYVPPRLRTERGYSFILTNVANYAGFGIVLDNQKPFCSGYFELHHFRRNLIKPMLRWFARLKFWKKKASNQKEGTVLYRLSQCRVTSHRSLFLQIDGEPISQRNPRHLIFRCIKGGLNILLQASVANATTQNAE
jgi:diacylglycerol kinase family enzyme